MACPCCVTSQVRIVVNGSDISQRVQSVSVDSSPDIMWEPESKDCIPQGTGWIYMYGPGKTTIQITAYPFEPPEDYTLGFPCATNISLTVPWKYIYDCRLCSPCFLPDGTIGQKRGLWKGIPMKKKQVVVTGDITSSPKFEVEGCPIAFPKFQVQASQQSIFLPQQSIQYNRLKYLGGPVPFDTLDLDGPFSVSIITQEGCGGFDNIDAYLTGFNVSYTPPDPTTVSYTMETLFAVCPGNC